MIFSRLLIIDAVNIVFISFKKWSFLNSIFDMRCFCFLIRRKRRLKVIDLIKTYDDVAPLIKTVNIGSVDSKVVISII